MKEFQEKEIDLRMKDTFLFTRVENLDNFPILSFQIGTKYFNLHPEDYTY
jgi:hypothetical protein